jgi:prevent-host-death family protein
MASVTTVAARNDFGNVLNRAAFGKERIIVERRGRPIAAVVPMDDIALLEALEDERDLRDARAARKESVRKGTKSLDRLRAELGD